MSKQKIGSIKQKTIIEGDENLLETGEILIQDSTDFLHVLKERKDGKVCTYVIMPIEDYIKGLEDAYNEGLNNGL